MGWVRVDLIEKFVTFSPMISSCSLFANGDCFELYPPKAKSLRNGKKSDDRGSEYICDIVWLAARMAKGALFVSWNLKELMVESIKGLDDALLSAAPSLVRVGWQAGGFALGPIPLRCFGELLRVILWSRRGVSTKCL